MEETLDRLVGRVRANMAVRSAGVSAEYALGVIEDVLAGLAEVQWEARAEAAICESEFDELIDRGPSPDVAPGGERAVR
jgi:hypothetical protein